MTERNPNGVVLEARVAESIVQPGAALVSVYDPGFRGVGMAEAAQVLYDAFGERWREVDLTDDDRHWTFEELLLRGLRDAVAPRPSVEEALDRSEGQAEVVAWPLTYMLEGGLVPAMRASLRDTGAGAEITAPFRSQAMFMVQFLRRQYSRKDTPDGFMYERFTMGLGPIIAAAEPEQTIDQLRQVGQPQKIGRLITEPELRITSQGLERQGEVLTYRLDS
jgi:hypothetical protein